MCGVIVYNYALKTASYLENVRLFSEHTGLNALTNKEIVLYMQNNPAAKIPFDFCIFLDKDIALARFLEKNGIRVFNSAATIETCDNKAYTQIALSGKVPMPDTFISPMTYFEPEFLNPIPYPIVIKECYGSWGEQVYLAKNNTEAKEIARKIGKKPYIIQAYMETGGTDYRIYTVGGKTVAAMKRENKTDFRANCELGGVASACVPAKEMLELAETTSEILHLDFGGIDLMETEKGAMVIEANSSAMTLHIEQTTGVNIPRLLLKHIQTFLK